MSLGDLASGGQQLTRSGRFAEDPVYAIKVLSKALDVLREKAGLKKGDVLTNEYEELPPRLLRGLG
jgi:hypothetical protein